MRFRILADGYDNGIQICLDKGICELNVFTAVGLTGANDAILVVKTVSQQNLLNPVHNAGLITVALNEKGIPKDLRLLGSNYIPRQSPKVGLLPWGPIRDNNPGDECYSNEYGFCPIYVNDIYYDWSSDQSKQIYGMVGVFNNDFVNDGLGIEIYDNSIKVIQLAYDQNGNIEDCIFSSPLKTLLTTSACTKRKIIASTAQTFYTATPTITITPLPSLTPTATEISPTVTITPTPTALPKTITSKTGLPVWMLGIIAILGIGIIGCVFYVIRSRRKK